MLIDRIPVSVPHVVSTSFPHSASCRALFDCAASLLAAPHAARAQVNYVVRNATASSQGTGLLYDNGTDVGIGTANPQSLLHIQTGEVQVGSSGAGCASNNGGAIRFNGTTLYYCNGSTWTTLSPGGAGGVLLDAGDTQIIGTSATNYYTGTSLEAGGTTPSIQYYALLTFYTPVIPAGINISKATLIVYCSHVNSADTISVYPITSSWSLGTVAGVAPQLMVQRAAPRHLR